MITNADLKTQTRRDLADFAKQLGLTGLQSMRKEELVEAIGKAQRVAKKGSSKKRSADSSVSSKTSPGTQRAAKSSALNKVASKSSSEKLPAVKTSKAGSPAKTKAAPRSRRSEAAPAATASKAKTKKSSVSQPAAAKGRVAKKADARSKPVSALPPTGRGTGRGSAGASGAEAKSDSSSSSGRNKRTTAKPSPRSATSSSPAVAAKRKKPLQSGRQEGRQVASNAPKKSATKPQRTPTAPKIVKVLRKQQADAESRKDLSVSLRATDHPPRTHQAVNGKSERGDRVVLIVRDSYWLQVCWEIGRSSVDRARAAMGADWHAATPILRLMEVGHGSAANSAETLVRDIPIHGGVNHWYVDVENPPGRYRALVGYRASTGRFYTLGRSNIVQTPAPGACDPIEGHWQEIAEDYERIYSLSEDENGTGSSELREMFEERLQRPMPDLTGDTPTGDPSDIGMRREKDLPFEVDAELIIFGSTTPGTTVTLTGKPVRLSADGSFTVRMELPDRRQVIPVVASSRDGMRQRTTVVAVERNTKVMEPVSRHNLE